MKLAGLLSVFVMFDLLLIAVIASLYVRQENDKSSKTILQAFSPRLLL